MLRYLSEISKKPYAYKVCSCKALNWGKNTNCIACGNTQFNKNIDSVLEAVNEEYRVVIKENHCSMYEVEYGYNLKV